MCSIIFCIISIQTAQYQMRTVITKTAKRLETALRYQASSRKTQERMEEIRWQTPWKEYSNLNHEMKEHLPTNAKVTSDPETKIKFLVEEGGFPNCADMGICLKLGTQDETAEDAGSLQYLKSIVHMKPTLEELINNYQFLHQTGSTFDFTYDSITSYAKCSFFSEDKDVMIDILLDIAFREKNMYEDNFETQIDLSNVVELVKRTAFDNKGIGMPSGGLGNVLTNANFLKFQQKIVPENTVISMSNVNNPDQTIAAILDKIKQKYPKYLQRVKVPTPQSVYKGGLKSYSSNGDFFHFAAAFPSVPFKDENMELFNILRVLLGTASSFSSGGPGKGMHSRCTKYLLNRVPCVESASFINEHFEEKGLFGLTVAGPHDTALDVIHCTLNQLAKLGQKVPEEELSRCKHILISSLSLNTQRQADRLEELTKHIFYYDRIRLHEYEAKIRKVTAEDIQKVIKNIFKEKPTFVYSGNGRSLKNLYSEKKLQDIFKGFQNNSK